jgi:hypothetical protein
MRFLVVASLLVFAAAPARADDRKTADKLSDMIDDLARIEGAADGCASVRDRIAELRGRMKALRDDLRGSSGGDAPAGPSAMDDKTFDRLKKRVDAESFADAKLRVIREAASANYFRSAQVAALLRSVTMSNDRLSALEALAVHIVDRANTFEILKAFEFDQDKQKAEKILARTR